MKTKIVRIFTFMLLLISSTYYFGIIVGKNKDTIILKYKTYYKLMCKWLSIGNRKISDYLLGEGIKSVAIYGMADMGKLLYQQLCDTGIDVTYFIGRRNGEGYKDIPLYGIESYLPAVDAIIVTPFLEFDEIAKKLRKKINCRIISLEEVINNAAV